MLNLRVMCFNVSDSALMKSKTADTSHDKVLAGTRWSWIEMNLDTNGSFPTGIPLTPMYSGVATPGPIRA